MQVFVLVGLHYENEVFDGCGVIGVYSSLEYANKVRDDRYKQYPRDIYCIFEKVLDETHNIVYFKE